MDCERFFDFVSSFGVVKKTDLNSEQLGQLAYEIIKELKFSDGYKTFLLNANYGLKLHSVTFGKYNISLRFGVADEKYSFIKFFKINMTHNTNFFTKKCLVTVEYGLYGKSNKKLFVNETSFEYDYNKMLNYVKPMLDNFCKDEI